MGAEKIPPVGLKVGAAAAGIPGVKVCQPR